jgi:hypothetical protein
MNEIHAFFEASACTRCGPVKIHSCKTYASQVGIRLAGMHRTGVHFRPTSHRPGTFQASILRASLGVPLP